MADVRRAVRDAWDRQGISSGDVVSVAVSGGADSLALAAASIFEGKRAGIDVFAVIVNHNLQKGSMEVALKAKETLLSLGFETVEVMEVQVKQTSIGMEAAARNARYGAIDDFARRYGAKFSMLGHTLDDQAETVLLGLARGSGPKSIAGMSALSADGKYLRPLLGLRRETTVAFCVDSGIKYWQDPQNIDTKFSRVKVRLNVLPILEKELGPGIANALARTAEILQEDNQYLEAQADIAFHASAKTTNNSVVLDIEELFQLAPAIRNRVIHNALVLLGAEPSKTHVDSVSSLLTNWHGQKPLTLPAVRVVRTGQEITLKSTKTLKPGAC
jgi:tRNA(Ile)-lysidine synthase